MWGWRCHAASLPQATSGEGWGMGGKDWFIHRKRLKVLREMGPVKPPFPSFLFYFSSICTIKAPFQRRKPEQQSSGSWDMDDLKYVFFLFWRIIPNEWRGFKALGDLKVGTSAPQ